jgi:hypothetical protein
VIVDCDSAALFVQEEGLVDYDGLRNVPSKVRTDVGCYAMSEEVGGGGSSWEVGRTSRGPYIPVEREPEE